MAAMTTALTEFSNSGNSRTSTLIGHTVSVPKIVIEKRRVPEGNQVMGEIGCKVIYATKDAADLVLTNKISFEAIVRYPIQGSSADVEAVRAIFADIIAGDEFKNAVETQEWL